jgi:hypothetical protein
MNTKAFIGAEDKHVVARIVGGQTFNRLLNTIPDGNSFVALDVDLTGAKEEMTVAFEQVDPSSPLHGATFTIEKIAKDELGTSRVTFRRELPEVADHELVADAETTQPEVDH